MSKYVIVAEPSTEKTLALPVGIDYMDVRVTLADQTTIHLPVQTNPCVLFWYRESG